MSGTAGGGDNWTGLGGLGGGWDDSTNVWSGQWGDAALPRSPWNTESDPTLPWWKDPKTAAQLKSLGTGMGGIKLLADPNAAGARPMAAAPGIHQGQGGGDALQQFLQALQQRQQAMRSQFMPKTAGLLGGG